MKRLPVELAILVVGGLLLTCCYYQPKTRRHKADPSFLSEAEAESLIQKKLAPYGIKFIYNMKLRRDGVSFIADGYDRDIRVGYEYRSHEGLDFEGEPQQSADGLSRSEIQALEDRQEAYREYFLIVSEGPRESVEEAVDGFVEKLYAWEVLKKAKKKKSTTDSLFPEKEGKDKDLLPWEATGSLKEKRKKMEAREELEGKPGEPGTESGDEEGWGGGDDTWDDDTKDSAGKTDEGKQDEVKEDEGKKSSSGGDDWGDVDEWGDEKEEDF